MATRVITHRLSGVIMVIQVTTIALVIRDIVIIRLPKLIDMVIVLITMSQLFQGQYDYCGF
jgi:hypothetical protein